MRLIYRGPHDEVEVPVDGELLMCRRDDTVEVPDAVGASLLSQGSSFDAEGNVIPPAHPAWERASRKRSTGGED